MPKLTIIGAGSFVFARRLITDMLTYPSLKDATIVLMNIDESKLETIAKFAIRMVDQEATDARI